MKKIEKKLAIMLALTMIVFAFAACGSRNGDGGGSADVESLETIGDAFALEAENNQYAVYDGKVVYAFQYNDTYYRVRADISDEEQQAYMDIGFDDEDYEAKQHEIIDPLKITEIENLSDMLLSQKELNALAGKTGKDLTDEGWTYQGSYYLDNMEVWMDYGPFEYCVHFDGSVQGNSDDLDIEDVTKDMKVKSAEFSSLGDATSVE